jgi:hypothetical protein
MQKRESLGDQRTRFLEPAASASYASRIYSRPQMCVPENLSPLCWLGPKITSPDFHGTPASIKCGAAFLEKRGSESEKSKINLGDTPYYLKISPNVAPAARGLFSWSSNDSIRHLERMRLVQMPQTI